MSRHADAAITHITYTPTCIHYTKSWLPTVFIYLLILFVLSVMDGYKPHLAITKEFPIYKWEIELSTSSNQETTNQWSMWGTCDLEQLNIWEGSNALSNLNLWSLIADLGRHQLHTGCSLGKTCDPHQIIPNKKLIPPTAWRDPPQDWKYLQQSLR